MKENAIIREQILVEKTRQLSDDQFNKLIDFLNSIIQDQEPSLSAKKQYLQFSQSISNQVQERGLTEEILQDILKEVHENRI